MDSVQSAHNACLVKRILLCVYDKRARMWGDIVSCPNEDVAARLVETLMSRPGLYHDYPNDYALYKVADCVDTETGVVITPVPCSILYEFSSFVKDSDNG